MSSRLTLEELNYKYPTCSTCQFRVMRYGRKNGKKVPQMAWCEHHNRPIEYHIYTDARGRKHIQGDKPCGDYAYQRSVSLFG